MLELDSPSSLLPLWAELTMPEVMVLRRAKGLPMATTNSPCRTSEERPRDRVGKGCWRKDDQICISTGELLCTCVCYGCVKCCYSLLQLLTDVKPLLTFAVILMVAMSATWSTSSTVAL